MPNLHVASHLGLKLEKNGAKNKIQSFPSPDQSGTDLVLLTRPELVSQTHTVALPVLLPSWIKASSGARQELTLVTSVHLP